MVTPADPNVDPRARASVARRKGAGKPVGLLRATFMRVHGVQEA